VGLVVLAPHIWKVEPIPVTDFGDDE